MLERVDVLIIGAGASGKAVTWSLVETKMRIVCLEQGDWVKPTDFPSNFRDSEARQMDEFSPSPGRGKRPHHRCVYSAWRAIRPTRRSSR
jgi:cation diffusion facilitator CzcD-associated flavoprotein CzcO